MPTTTSAQGPGEPAPRPVATRSPLGRLGERLRGPHAPLAILALALLPLCFGLMVAHLGAKPFWVDESIAVLPARSILSTGLPRSPFDCNYMEPQLQDGLWDPSAPLYRYAVAAVTAVTGFSETTTRGFSVACGLLLLWPFFLLGRRVCGERTAWLSVAVLAALPAYAEQCREARHFSFVALTMTACLYFLLRAAEGDERARGLWPVLLVATLLAHAVGYEVLPVAAAFLVEVGPRRLLSRRWLPVYLVVGAAYAALELKYGRTLPFFFPVNCDNRVAGCEPNPLYYFEVIGAYFGLFDALQAVWRQPLGTAPLLAVVTCLPLGLLVAGIVASVRDAVRGRGRREQHVLLLAWFALPLLLMSMEELKFARYIFYVLPPLALLVARGAEALAQRFGRFSTPAMLAIGVLAIVGPEPAGRTVEGAPHPAGARFVRYARHALDDDSRDGWEHIRAQVDYLHAHLRPGDEVVSSFDDPSLTYYLGRFVYGFLDSEHDDKFFLHLLDQARRRHARVYFLDTLASQNHCHTPGLRPLNIDCREKYARFYAACTEGSPTRDPTCVRWIVPSQ